MNLIVRSPPAPAVKLVLAICRSGNALATVTVVRADGDPCPGAGGGAATRKTRRAATAKHLMLRFVRLE